MTDLHKLERKLERKIANVATRGFVDAPGPAGVEHQVEGLGGRLLPDTEHFQPQGLHFQPPVGAEGLVVSPVGILEDAIMLAAADRRALPTDLLAAGEGGLHYLGAWKVFVNADGTVSLGEKMPDSFVALADLVNAEFARVKSDISALKGFTSAGLTAVGVALAANGPAAATAFDSATVAIPSDPGDVSATNTRAS